MNNYFKLKRLDFLREIAIQKQFKKGNNIYDVLEPEERKEALQLEKELENRK